MMPETLRVLGQAAPAANTDTTVYTVGSGKSAVVSTITVCNRDPGNATFRIAVSPGGAALANPHYIYYDAPLPGNSTFAATVGLSVGPGDVVRVRASTGNLSFSIFGSEVT